MTMLIEQKVRITGTVIISLLCVSLGFGLSGQAQAELILNGDFEDNTAGSSVFNMSNASFTAAVSHATAFGTSEEIDLVTGTDYGVEPQSGDWKLGLHNHSDSPTNVDAFSLDLSSPLVGGNTYSLRFYAAGKTASQLGPVEIGISSSATSFGTMIFSGMPASTAGWKKFNHDFVASFDASYLTVRNAQQLDMYVFVDNFSLVPEPATVVLLALGGSVLRRRR